MTGQNVEITVYGAEQLCQSCVALPSSKDTFEWLKAAISRKFPNQPFDLTYVDIFNPPNQAAKQELAEKIIQGEMIYPVVVIQDQIVGEGNPHLKTIFLEMKKYGYQDSY